MSLLKTLGLAPELARLSGATASVASGAGISTQNEGKNQSSLRTLVSDPLKNPGQTGTKGQNAAILEQKPKSADEIPGMGQGQKQAIGKAEYDKAEELVKAGWNWINKQGETKIIIKNRTSKVMSFVKETDVLDKPGQSKWSRKAAPEIAAGGEDNMVVKTDMTIRGVTRANTSGSVVYEIAGKDDKARTAKVRLAWTRKGDKGMDMKDDWQTDTLAFEVKAQQTADGEFTFFVSEKKAADAKAKDPQDADDAKGKEPPPPDIFVLFDVGKSVLKSEAKSKLHEYAMAYLASKSAARIHCEGYASIEGKDADNTNLSYERAEAVFTFLTDPKTGNLPQDKVGFHGSGITKGFDPKNFPPNRRVTVGGSAAKVPAGKATDTKTEPQSPADPKAKVQERDKEEPPMRPAVPGSASRTGA
jgi:outer membrane protein OmpA-like peptidoglycan-associated protein